ncbi:MAG: transglycosylase SLT domain-containing protein [candidate division KSB1 bacterium]|nr:transglycosylase SLT domain-containing protein [candidate division KSB1 bacterium]
MLKIDATIWQVARRALEKAVALYFDDPNVSHIDLGYRILTSKGNHLEPELAVRVHVRRKLRGKAFEDFAARFPHRVIDAERVGFAIDVPQASYRLDWWQEPSATRHDTKKFHSPLLAGLGIFNAKTNRLGTLGGKVRCRHSNEVMLLSTWHVLAGSSNASMGESIYQLARPHDTGEVKPLVEFTRHAMEANLDAAVARLRGEQQLLSEHAEFGAVTGAVIPQLGMRVTKTGLGSGVTSGVITGIMGYSIHRYVGQRHLIRDIVHLAPAEPEKKISSPGDSGAWWMEDAHSRAAALHFAGSHQANFALALSMPEVMSALDVDIVTEKASSSLVFIPTIAVKQEAEAVTERALVLQTKALAIAEARFPITPPRKARRLAHASLIAAICATIFGFGFQLQKNNRQQKQKIERLERGVLQLQMIKTIDSTRSHQVRKVSAIINRLNPDMSLELQFRLANEICAMSRKYDNLNVELICATITHETGYTWDPKAVSPAGALGLMQILPKTALLLTQEEGMAWTSAEQILFDPILNVRLGCRYLSALVKAYSVDAGLAAYHGGPKRAERWIRNGRAEGVLHRETAAYVPSVLRIYDEYQRLAAEENRL